MELNKRSPNQMTELREELATLSKQHFDALPSAVYLGLNEKEADEYDQSRVSELCELLEKFIDNDVRNWS
jgi:hypothetical protein